MSKKNSLVVAFVILGVVSAATAHSFGRKSDICGAWNNYCKGLPTTRGELPTRDPAPTHAPTAGDTARAIARDADRLYERRDWAAAEREYRRAIGIDSSYGYAWSKLGETLQEQGLYSEALDAYRRAADLGRPQAKNNYEHLSEWLRKQIAAREAWEATRKRDEDRQRTYDDAKRIENRSEYLLLAQLWRDYLKRYPNDAYALHNLGRSLYLARIANPKLPRETVDEAVNALTRAIRLEPSNGIHHERMMLLLALIGRAGEAVAFADEAARKNTDRERLASSFWYMIDSALKHGSYGAAERMIEIGARIFPANVTNARYGELRVAQYNAAVNVGDKTGAVGSARALIELYPQRHDYHSLLGNALFRNDRADEAKRAYGRAIELVPDAERVDLLYKFGRDLESVGDWVTAADIAKRRLALIPASDTGKSAAAESNLGYALYRLGDKTTGLATMYRGIARVANSADFPEWLVIHGNNLALLGEYQRAVAVYEQALKLQPGNKDAAARLAEVRPKVSQTPTGQPLGPLIPGDPGRKPSTQAGSSIANSTGSEGGAKGQATGAAVTGALGAGIVNFNVEGGATEAGRIFDKGDIKTPGAGPGVVITGMKDRQQPIEVPKRVLNDPRWRGLELVEEMHLAEKAVAEKNVQKIEQKIEKGEGNKGDLHVELVKAKDAISKAEAELNMIVVKKKELRVEIEMVEEDGKNPKMP